MSQNGVELIIHCGDLAAPAMLTKVLAPKFSGEIHMVHGNVGDPDLLEQVAMNFSNVTIHGMVGKIEINGKKIAFTHFPEKALELAKKNTFDLVFYGHTHKPWEEKLGDTKLINPGTLAGMFYRATFAVYDSMNDKLELKILDQIN